MLTPRADDAVAASSPLPRNLPRLTALRGPAALLVFAFHIANDTEWLPFSIPFVSAGYVGVALFYVLSGFVLTWSARPGGSARGFWLRRFAKVYPSHLLFAIVALVLPVVALPRTVLTSLANVFLLQAWIPTREFAYSLDAVSWSLSCEAFFYLIAPFVIGWAARGSLRRAVVLLGAWWGATVVCWAVADMLRDALYGVGSDPGIVSYVFPPVRSGEFALGILCAVLLRRMQRFPRIPVIAPLLVTLVVLGVLGMVDLPNGVAGFVISPFFALLVVALAQADIAGRSGIGHHPWLVLAGEASFAFYLVHELVILNVVAGVGPRLPVLHGVALTVGCLVVAALLALAAHRWWELPVQRWILRRWGHRADAGHGPRAAAAS